MRRRTELLLSSIPVLWLFTLFAVPTAVVVMFAFRPADLYGNIGASWTLNTFRAITAHPFWPVAWRTVWLSLVSTVLCVLFALPVAYWLAQVERKWRNLLLMLVMIPFWVSFIIRLFAWKALLHPEGFLKQILVWIGLAAPDAILLYSPATVLVVMVYTYLPFAILPLYAAAADFDFSLCEAAMDLGLPQWKAFWHVFVPGVRSGITTAALMVLVPLAGAYIIPEVVGGTDSEMLGNLIVQKTFIRRNLPEASALSLVLAGGILAIVATLAWSRRRQP